MEKETKKRIFGAVLVCLLMFTASASIGYIVSEDTIKADEQKYTLLGGHYGRQSTINQFTYYKIITIDHELVDETLTNYPVLINVTDTDLRDNVQNDSGYDIAFFNESNVQLNHDIEYWDDSTGQLVAWVNVTSISSSIDTEIKIYYGNATIENQRDMDNTWGGMFSAVYHMNTSDTPLFDSSGNGHALDENDDPTYEQAGLMKYCVYGDGTTDSWDTANHADFNMGAGDFTIMVVVKPDANADTDFYAAKGSASSGTASRYSVGINATGVPEIAIDDANPDAIAEQATTDITDGEWHHLVYIRENDALGAGHDELRIWVDKIQEGSKDIGDYGDLDDNAEPFYIGPRDGWSSQCLDGYLDYVWIIKGSAMSDGWVNTTYNNIFNSSNFISFGAQQGSSDASSFILKGLEGSNDNITWTGLEDSTVWSNATGGSGGTMEINMSINSTDNVTEMRIWVDDLDASIGASNITLYCANYTNITFYSFGSFDNSGSNISINQSTWDTATGGGVFNPFDGAGLTDTNTSIFCRFKLVIPAGTAAGTYTQSDWKVYIGYYS